MYLPRRDDSDICAMGTTGCMSYAITGSDPSEKDDDTSFGGSNYGKPGPHRYIGIGMVAGMIFLVLVAYCVYGKGPRRVRQKIWWYLGRRRKDEEEEGAAMKQVAVVLQTTSSASSSSSSEEKPRHHTPHKQDDELGMKSRKSTSRGRSRSRSKSKHGKSRRVSQGGVVRNSKEGQDVGGEPGNVIMGWEVDHRRSVHYEVDSTVSGSNAEPRSEKSKARSPRTKAISRISPMIAEAQSG